MAEIFEKPAVGRKSDNSIGNAAAELSETVLGPRWCKRWDKHQQAQEKAPQTLWGQEIGELKTLSK